MVIMTIAMAIGMAQLIMEELVTITIVVVATMTCKQNSTGEENKTRLDFIKKLVT